MACFSLVTLTLSLLLSLLSSVRCAPNATSINNQVMNPIDSCWRGNPNWASNRKALANCAVGFGKAATGGKYGEHYVVTDASDDPEEPRPGTLRWGVIQDKPLWITFATSMGIKLKNELMLNSYKTIDGRGVKVEIGYGPCITIQHVSHVIIHGISIHDCERGTPGIVRDSPTHKGHRLGSDGDAVDIFESSHVWIDHCNLFRSFDGLIDVVHGSRFVTISNNLFSNHNHVMLLGHDDSYLADGELKVTVAFNHFGPGLIQRMPRVRLGYAHVANNRYSEWGMYAIGGSANPTIFSEGNYFMAPNNPNGKQVTKREGQQAWNNWKWKTSRDSFVNGAYFIQSGNGDSDPPYSKTQAFNVADGSMVPALTSDAGVLNCQANSAC